MPEPWDISTHALRAHLAEIAEYPNRPLVMMSQGLIVAAFTALIEAREKIEATHPTPFVDVVFEGAPGPDGLRFVEVETEHGAGVKLGQWLERHNGQWVLRVAIGDVAKALTQRAELNEEEAASLSRSIRSTNA